MSVCQPRYILASTEVGFPGTAGAGSLILEFGMLSSLTGDDRFEKAEYKAFFALWNQRSDINLVGNTVNIFTGVRHNSHFTSIASADALI